MFQKIEEDRKFTFTGLAILSLTFLFLNSKFWHNLVVNLLFVICYLLFVSIWLGKILGRILNLEKDLKFLFGLFLALYLIAFGLAVPIFFYRISTIYFFIFLFFFTLAISFFNHQFISTTNYKSDTNIQFTNNKTIEIPKSVKFIVYGLWFIIYILSWFFLFKARTGEKLISPWQIISPVYLYLCFGLFFLTILFIFSGKKITTILFFIILTSLLVHAYLPIVHENNFGVDKWRHLGVERRLITGQIESPALFGEELKYKKIGPLAIPEVFLVGNKNSYAGSWGLTIALSWLIGIDIFWIDLFLIFALWSVFLPILVFKLVDLIFADKKIALLSAFSTLIPYVFQADGAITLPKNIGFLVFIFFLIIISEYLKDNKKILPLIIFFFVLLYFNYILFLILSLEIFVFGLILKGQQGKSKVIILSVLFIIFSLSLILLDRASGVSFFQYKIPEIRQIFPAKLSDFWQEVIQGKYFYYQGKYPDDAPFLSLIKLGLFFTPLALILTLFGTLNFRRNLLVKLLAFFLIILLINQFLSESFMKNYRLLARRSSMVIILLLIIFFSAGLIRLFEKIKINFNLKVIILSLILALFVSTTYASGPYYLGTVTSHQVKVAKFISQEIKKEAEKRFCVLDASWRLLALESVIGMIAGNFPTHPIDFVQKERDELYKKILQEPSREILDESLKITDADSCFFVTEQHRLKPNVFDKIKEILGEPIIMNNVYIWQYKQK